jgi:hypothetical protein
MGLNNSPGIVTDSLVAAYDIANPRCFRGEPTTNELVGLTWAGDGSNQTGFVKGSILVTDPTLRYNGLDTYLYSPGTSANGYLNGVADISSETSTVWTFSAYLKREDGAPITSMNVFLYFPTSDGSAAGTIESVGNGWYRVSRTRTGSAAAVTLVGFTPFAVNTKYYISGAQLEKKSYATHPTTINTTRGATVATGGGLIDLSKNGYNGQFFNEVVHNGANRGYLLFNGTTQYCATTLNTIGPNMTYDFWSYLTSSLYAYNMMAGFNVPYFSYYSTGSILFSAMINGTQRNLFAGSGFHTGGVWNNLVFTTTYDGSNTTTRIYHNGSLLGTSTAWAGANNASGTYPLTLGSWRPLQNDNNFNGRIGNVKIYNKALTLEEIKQNFNATRGRYGV